MKKFLLISGVILLLVIILIMSFGIQIGNVKIGKQDDSLSIEQKYEIENSEFHNEFLKSDKLLLVNLWATWCKPCIQEMPLLNEIKKEYSDKNVEFLSFSVDKDSTALVNFLNSEKFEFEDITIENLEYRTTILNYLNNKPANNKINSYAVPVTYLIKDEKILKKFEGVFDSKRELTSEIDKALE